MSTADSSLSHSIASRIVGLDSLESNRPFLQAGFWGRFKEKFGWKAFAVEIIVGTPNGQKDSKFFEYRLLVLVRRVFRVTHFAYIPHGPDLSWFETLGPATGLDERAILGELSRQIASVLPMKCAFVRWDPDWVVASRPALESESLFNDEEALSPTPTDSEIQTEHEESKEKQRLTTILSSQLRKANADVQPPNTVILDISESAEKILAGMKSKTRYNVRLSEKKGVEVTRVGPDRLEEWYALYKLTAERDKIAVHSFLYYRELFVANRDHIDLFLAAHENHLLAGIVVLYWGKKATYLYGASSNIKRNLMPTYALQWQAILEAKSRACTSYDLFGLPERADPDHPMYGLYQFKTGFGGNLVSYPGSWDFPLNGLFYLCMRAAESLRYFYFKRVRKSR